jgi:hypothetical protein
VAGDPEGARDRFAALLPLIEQALGLDDPWTLGVHLELSWWSGLAGNAVGAREAITYPGTRSKLTLAADPPARPTERA